METEYNNLKQRMYLMRNGIIADTLRKAGSPFRVIFGLNLPQIVDIAKETGRNRALAERMWSNSTSRESMLIAPMLVPMDGFTYDDAKRWANEVPATEVADILCHRLLRHQPYALDLAQNLYQSESKMERYTALRLMCNIASHHPEEATAMGQQELSRHDPQTRLMALQLTGLTL